MNNTENTKTTIVSELPLEHCAEYDSAAEWCAKRGLKGEIGDPLPANMSASGALQWINADPESFQERVRQFAYAQSMESIRCNEYCVHFDSEAEALAYLRSMNILDVHNYAIVEGPDDGQFSVVDAETAKEFSPWSNI